MPAVLDAPTYLTVQEAADLVRVNPRTIRNRIREGKLRAKKFGADGRALLLDQRDVLELLTEARPADPEKFVEIETKTQGTETQETEPAKVAVATEPAKVAVATEPAKVAVAFEGWVEQVSDGMATLRLVDQGGQRSVATYAVTDLQRDHIPAEAGTAFRCQVIRENTGFRVIFQPVPRRVVSKAHRKQLEEEMVSAYSTLTNDY